MFARNIDSTLADVMDRARRDMDAHVDYALGKARETEARAGELERQAAREHVPPSDENVARFKSFILTHANTEQWQRLIARIDQGELDWKQVIDDLTSGKLDRDEEAAFNSIATLPMPDIESLRAAEDAPAQHAEVSTTSARTNEEEEDFSERSIYGDDEP